MLFLARIVLDVIVFPGINSCGKVCGPEGRIIPVVRGSRRIAG
jgi:hypothetical protein